MSLTEFIFRHARTVFNGVDKVIGEEKRQRAEYGGAIHGVEGIVKFAQGHGMMEPGQGAINEQTGGSGFHATALQARNIGFRAHRLIMETGTAEEFAEQRC